MARTGMDFNPKKLEELEQIRDVLMNSRAVQCEAVEPEVVFNGHTSYLLHGYDQRVTVDFNKMAKALYKAWYRKGDPNA